MKTRKSAKSEAPWAGISVADPTGNAAPGVGKEHVEEAVVRLAQTLLRAGWNLAYGGDLRPGGFTRVLFDIARAESASVTETNPWWRRLADYLAWPFSETLTPDEHAKLIHLCRFVKIEPAGFAALRPKLEAMSDAEKAPWIGLSLATMRRSMQLGGAVDDDKQPMPGLALRVVLGGKLAKFSGFLPGIWEEAALAIAARTPVLVFGGFGGAAGALARLLLRAPAATKPFLEQRALIERLRIPTSEGITPPLESLDLLLRVAAEKRQFSSLRLGLPIDAVNAMLTTRDVDRACRIAKAAASAIAEKRGSR